MSASTVLSVIAPVSGAAPSPSSAAGDEATSAEFAAMVAGANPDEAQTETAEPTGSQAGGESRAAPRREGVHILIHAKSASAAAAADVADADSLQTEAAKASAGLEGEGAASDDLAATAEGGEPTQSETTADIAGADAQPEPPAVPGRLPAQASPVAQAVARTVSGATPPKDANPSAPSGDGAPPAPSLPAQAPDTAQTAMAAAHAEVPSQSPPPRAEPARLAAAAHEARSGVAASPASADTATTGKSDLAATPAAAPAAQTQKPAVETAAMSGRGFEALKPLPASDTTVPAPASSDLLSSASTTAQPQAAVTASALSRATVETTIQIAARIVRQLEAKQTRFDMVLTPEDLGRVEVSLDIDADGQLAARLAFDNPAAAADLRGRADELRRQLTDAGFQLAGDSLEFSERDANAFSGGAFERGQDRAFSFAGGKRLGDQADLAAVAPAAWINLSLTPDRVDMRV